MTFRNNQAATIASAILDAGLSDNIAQEIHTLGVASLTRSQVLVPVGPADPNAQYPVGTYGIKPEWVSQYATIDVWVKSAVNDGGIETVTVGNATFFYRRDLSNVYISVPLDLALSNYGYYVAFSQDEANRATGVSITTRDDGRVKYRTGDYFAPNGSSYTWRETPTSTIITTLFTPPAGTKYIYLPVHAGQEMSIGMQIAGATGTTTAIVRDLITGAPLSPTGTVTGSGNFVLKSSPLPMSPIDLRVTFPTAYSSFSILVTYPE